jgi:hypothetical protein
MIFCHCINKNSGRKSQGMIELALILPLLVVIFLGIFEYSIFQRNVSAVQDIAAEAAIAASKHHIDENSPVINASAPYDPSENIAVEEAFNVVRNRLVTIGLPEDLQFEFNNLGSAFGARPFALYKFDSTRTVDYQGTTKPMISFDVDYRDPRGKGVSTQLVYHYNLILFGVAFHLPGGRSIVIIPNNVMISSTQTRQYVYY